MSHSNDKKVYILGNKYKPVDLSQYTHIRVYHACRPTNIDEYLKNGIHDFTRQEAYDIAMSRLKQCGIDEQTIKEVFNEHWDNSIHHFDKICACISKDQLLNEAGHYLVYGSEFINGIAAQLFCQDELKQIGVPTIFVCDVEISKIPLDVLELIEDGKFFNGAWDGGIYLRGNIEADEIVDYIQPKKMFDPIQWRNYTYNGKGI